MKTTSAASEKQEIRLGLGQVLHYRAWMRSEGWKALAYLVITSEPKGTHLLAACDEAGVKVAWPGAFERLGI